MHQVGTESSLSALLDVVERGEEVVIVRAGKPVARLIPAEVTPHDKALAAIQRIKELRRGVILGEDVTISQLIAEGRR